MKSGLLIYTPDYTLTFLTGATEAEAREHIKNGYPELLADYDGGKVLTKEVELPDEANLFETSFDGEKFAPLDAAGVAKMEAAPKPISTSTIMALIQTETIAFMAARLLGDHRITQEEHDYIISGQK